MKPTVSLVKFAPIAATFALATSIHAADGTWTGGTNTWNTSNTNWSGVGVNPWNSTNGPSNKAIFGSSAGEVTVSGTVFAGALEFNAGTRTISSGILTLGDNSTGSFTPTINTLTNATISSNLAGNDGFTKIGAGTLTINTATANTITGTINVNQGKLHLDYSNSGSNTAKLATSSTLALGGGTFQVTGFPTTYTTAPSFNGLTINSGASSAISTKTGTATVGVNYGSISRNGIGGTVDFSGTGLHQTSTQTNVNGIIGGYATYNANTWVVAGSGFSNLAALSSFSTTAASTAASNVDVTASATLSSTAIPAGPSAANSLRFNTGAATTLTLNGATNITTGGILVTSNVGNNASKITGGTSLAGAAGADLIVHQHNTANTLTIESNIVNNGTTGLTKSGAGELILSGTNSYTGNTYVNAGILTFAKAASFYGSTGGAVTGTNAQKLIVNSGVTASFNVASGNFNTTDFSTLLSNSTATTGFKSGSSLGIDTTGVAGGTYTYGAAITDANGGANSIGLTKAGTGTLALANTNTHTGATTIAAGTLNLSNTGALGASTFTGGVGTLVFDASVASHTFTFGGLSGSKNIALTDNGSNAVALTVGANHSSTSYSGALSGSGSLTKSGTGLLVLDGTNAHTGGTTVSNGTLKVSGTLGASTGTVHVGSAGTLYLGGTQQTTGAVTLSGGTITGGMLNATSFSATGGNVSTALTGSGALTKTTAGTLTVSGANTYSGGTNLNDGTIVIGASGVAGTNIPSGYKIAAVGDSITVGGWPGILQDQLRARMGNSNVTVSNYGNSGSTAIYQAGNIGPAHPYYGSSQYNSAIASNPNAVIIQLGTNDSIGTVSQINSFYANDLTQIINQFKATANNPDIYLCLAPAIYSNTGAQDETKLVNNIFPLIQQVATATGATVIDNHTMLQNEEILFPDKLHPNTQGQTMLGQNIYATLASEYFTNGPLGTGTVTLSGGTLSDDGSARTLKNSLAITGNITFASTGNGSLKFDSTGLAVPATATLSNNPTLTVTNTTTIAHNISGSGFTKAGAGTLVLSGTNTYTGATAINGGTLALTDAGTLGTTNEVALGGGTLDVNAKAGGYSVAKVTGSGNVIGSLTVSSQLAIGNSAGTVNFDDLTVGSLSTSVFEVGGGAGDLANVGDDFTLGGTLDLNLLSGQSYVANQVYTLFGYTAGNLLGGTFKDGLGNTLFDGATFTDAGGIWMIDYDATTAGLNGGSGDRFITVTAVPEPSAALLGGLSLLALLRRRRA